MAGIWFYFVFLISVVRVAQACKCATRHPQSVFCNTDFGKFSVTRSSARWHPRKISTRPSICSPEIFGLQFDTSTQSTHYFRKIYLKCQPWFSTSWIPITLWKMLEICLDDMTSYPEMFQLKCLASKSSLVRYLINPLRPNNDLSQTSHCNIKGVSVREVMRIENKITPVKFYCYFNSFSPLLQ